MLAIEAGSAFLSRVLCGGLVGLANFQMDFQMPLVYRQTMTDLFSPRLWHLAHGRTLELGPKAVLMGILNVTPDSFSDGGKYNALDTAISRAREMVGQGASIIDVGGESSRPGAEPVSLEEEQARILDIVAALAAEGIIVSVDTWRSSTAKAALDAGAHIINDIWGFQKDPDLAAIAAQAGAGVCAMHTGRDREKLADVIEDQILYLGKSLNILEAAGVAQANIMLDPGFGFAKDPEENISLLARMEALHEFGFPLLIGTSRKRFIGHFTGEEVENREIGTAATSVVARMKGGAVFRVHDIPVNKGALLMADAVINSAGHADGK